MLAVCQAQFWELDVNPYNRSSVILGPILQMRKQAKLKGVPEVTVKCSYSALVLLGNNRAASNIGIQCHCCLHNADLKQKQTGARNVLLRCLSVLQAVLKEA